MICPFCGEDNDKVIDSRASEGGLVIRRRRECLGCDHRYTTYERVERTTRLTVVKRDGSRVPFVIENVLKGIHAACGKRPVPEAMKEQIARTIEDELFREFDREVESRVIGERVAASLREVDEIAYFRFAIEYHNLSTLDDLADELRDLKSRPKNLPNQRPLFSPES